MPKYGEILVSADEYILKKIYSSADTSVSPYFGSSMQNRMLRLNLKKVHIPSLSAQTIYIQDHDTIKYTG